MEQNYSDPSSLPGTLPCPVCSAALEAGEDLWLLAIQRLLLINTVCLAQNLILWCVPDVAMYSSSSIRKIFAATIDELAGA
jgi:hypothetical protein